MGYDDKTDCLRQKITQLFGDLAFYLWGVSLVIAIGLTLRSVANSHFDTHVLWLLAASGLAACLWQFGAGKIAGRYFNDYIAGRASGRKTRCLPSGLPIHIFRR